MAVRRREAPNLSGSTLYVVRVSARVSEKTWGYMIDNDLINIDLSRARLFKTPAAAERYFHSWDSDTWTRQVVAIEQTFLGQRLSPCS